MSEKLIMSKVKSTLVLGPLASIQSPDKTGGIVVLFGNFVQWLQSNEVDFEVIDINKSNYQNRYVAYIEILVKLIKKQSRYDSISLHGTVKDFLYIAPFVVFICKALRKKVILRKFAGSFNQIYNHSGYFKKKIFNYILRGASELHFETLQLVEFGKRFNSNSNWLPNVRNKIGDKFYDKKYNKKFLFLSHVSKEKGIDVLVNAFKGLDESYTLSIYGPCFDVKVDELNFHNIKYLGVVEHINVSKIITQNDVIVLPSKRIDEGYPGVFIEAFSIGRPVIASKIGGIPEIIKDKMNGLLIDVGSSVQLKEAILSINDENYRNMCKGSYDSFDLFESNKVYNELFFKLI